MSDQNGIDREHYHNSEAGHYFDNSYALDKERVLSILKPGTFIKTQMGSSNKWDINTIVRVTEDDIVLPFIEDDALAAILPGDIIRCRFATETHDINLLCNVKEVNFHYLPTKVLKIAKIDVWRNKRGSTRHNAGFMSYALSETQSEFVAYMINISDSGAGLICKEHLRIGSNIKVSFYGNEKNALDVIATIVRSKKNHDNKMEYGIRFFNLRNEVRTRLMNIIMDAKVKEEEIFKQICKIYNITPYLHILPGI